MAKESMNSNQAQTQSAVDQAAELSRATNCTFAAALNRITRQRPELAGQVKRAQFDARMSPTARRQLSRITPAHQRFNERSITR